MWLPLEQYFLYCEVENHKYSGIVNLRYIVYFSSNLMSFFLENRNWDFLIRDLSFLFSHPEPKAPGDKKKIYGLGVYSWIVVILNQERIFMFCSRKTKSIAKSYDYVSIFNNTSIHFSRQKTSIFYQASHVSHMFVEYTNILIIAIHCRFGIFFSIHSMQTTSHFIWLALKAEIFSDIFVRIYQYVHENHMEDAVVFQNPLSVHITLYYLEKHLAADIKHDIKQYIPSFDMSKPLSVAGWNYFFRWDKKSVLYCTSTTQLPLKAYRDILHERYERNDVEDNHFPFSPHITFLRIRESGIFEQHRKNIESILTEELQKLCDVDVNAGQIGLYAVNSHFTEEIQIIV